MKPQQFGFPSLEAMTENEIEVMQKARELYEYIPEVINYDRETQQLTVTRVEGEHIDAYIKRTLDLSIIDKLQNAIKKLQSKEISLTHRYEDHYKEGYIVYHDYHPGNFMIDNERNVWLIGWDIAGVLPNYRLPDEQMELDDFIDYLRKLV
jgi:thiamine kinase-like enzyme